MIRVLITGDRNWNCDAVALGIVTALSVRHGQDVLIVHGAATGVDTAFAKACDLLEMAHEPHPADWATHGKAAGPRRNAEMVRSGAKFCLALHRNLAWSRGTRDCVRRCLAADIPVWLIDSENGTPRRITSLD